MYTNRYTSPSVVSRDDVVSHGRFTASIAMHSHARPEAVDTSMSHVAISGSEAGHLGHRAIAFASVRCASHKLAPKT
jgi:hypothetical protein